MFTEHCSVWCTCVKIRGTHAPKMAARVASSRVTEPKIGFASTSTLHATQHQLEYSISYYIYYIYTIRIQDIHIHVHTARNHATQPLTSTVPDFGWCILLLCTVFLKYGQLDFLKLVTAFPIMLRSPRWALKTQELHTQLCNMQCNLVNRTVSPETKFIPLCP